MNIHDAKFPLRSSESVDGQAGCRTGRLRTQCDPYDKGQMLTTDQGAPTLAEALAATQAAGRRRIKKSDPVRVDRSRFIQWVNRGVLEEHEEAPEGTVEEPAADPADTEVADQESEGSES